MVARALLDDAAMAKKDSIELHARLVLTNDQLTGEVGAAGRLPVAFSGWLGLLSAIERATAGPDLRRPSDMGEPPPAGTEKTR